MSSPLRPAIGRLIALGLLASASSASVDCVDYSAAERRSRTSEPRGFRDGGLVDSGAPAGVPAEGSEEETTSPSSARLPQRVFERAGAYSPHAPPESAQHHGGVSNAYKDCLACHRAGTGIIAFTVAGTAVRSRARPEPEQNAEVRVVGPDGRELATVTTDSAGNFWIPVGALPSLPAGALVGVRNGVFTSQMAAPIVSGACNQQGCHASPNLIVLAE